MTMSDRDKKILLVLLPVVVLAAYWFLLLAPKREEATTASAALTEQEGRLEAARAAAASADNAQDDFEATYASVVRLGKAIPSTVDMPSLLVQLDSAAAGTGIHFTTIVAGERTVVEAPAPATPPDGAPPAAAGGETAQSAPGTATESANNAQQTANAQAGQAEQTTATDTQTSTSSGGGLPVGGGAAAPADPAAAATVPAGLEMVPLEMEFEGNFFNLADFFHDLKRFVQLTNEDVLVSGRLLTVESVRWASDASIFPRLRAQVTANVYLSPLAQGVTAGATPQGPAPATSVGPETTPAGTAPAPAAPAPTATATP
jgi:Pilus assembly protein, PilO